MKTLNVLITGSDYKDAETVFCHLFQNYEHLNICLLGDASTGINKRAKAFAKANNHTLCKNQEEFTDEPKALLCFQSIRTGRNIQKNLNTAIHLAKENNWQMRGYDTTNKKYYRIA